MRYLKVILNGSGLVRGASLIFFMGVEGGILGLILFVILAAFGLPLFIFISLLLGSWDLIKLEAEVDFARNKEKYDWANRDGSYENDPELNWEVMADFREKSIREGWFRR